MSVPTKAYNEVKSQLYTLGEGLGLYLHYAGIILE